MARKKKEPEHDQAVDPDPDYDFRDEELPDNTRPPVGRPVEDEGK